MTDVNREFHRIYWRPNATVVWIKAGDFAHYDDVYTKYWSLCNAGNDVKWIHVIELESVFVEDFGRRE